MHASVHASSGKKMSFDMISHSEISEAEKREEEDKTSTSEEESSLTSESDDANVHSQHLFELLRG